MDKILVIVRGGVVQSVMCSEDCEVAIIDWDNIEAGQTELVEYDKQTAVAENDLNFEVETANNAIKDNEE